jgi:hypothetical protein
MAGSCFFRLDLSVEDLVIFFSFFSFLCLALCFCLELLGGLAKGYKKPVNGTG